MISIKVIIRDTRNERLDGPGRREIFGHDLGADSAIYPIDHTHANFPKNGIMIVEPVSRRILHAANASYASTPIDLEPTVTVENRLAVGIDILSGDSREVPGIGNAA